MSEPRAGPAKRLATAARAHVIKSARVTVERRATVVEPWRTV